MQNVHFTLFLKEKKLLDIFLYRVQELNQLFSRKILFQANGHGLMRTNLQQSILFHFFMLSYIITMRCLYISDLINYRTKLYHFWLDSGPGFSQEKLQLCSSVTPPMADIHLPALFGFSPQFQWFSNISHHFQHQF